MIWSQNYAPLGGIGLSALVASVPVVVLLGLLAFWHVRAHLAAIVALVVAGAIAIVVYGMPPSLALASAGYGAAFGLLPIGWLILNAIFIYQISVETGQFAVLQKQIAGISGRPPHPGPADRLQLRRLHRRRRRLRRSRRHLRRAHDRPRLPPARSRQTRPHRQHRPRRLRLPRHAPHHARAAHRPRPPRPQRHGRPAAPDSSRSSSRSG
jgi:hypothetical protein